MKYCFAGILFTLVSHLPFVQLTAVPPAPLQNYCPVVVVNNTGVASDLVYFVSNALDQDGSPCFLVPDEDGICHYVYPGQDGASGSAISSKTLSQLPIATGTGITGDARLLYLPINTSARGYFSISNPLFLSTTTSPNGNVVINSPSVVSLNDPNYYTLYQDFEFGLDGSSADSSTNLYMNLSWVDFFSLPMKLYANTYSGNVLIDSDVCQPSGMPSDSTREGIIGVTKAALDGYLSTWGCLPVPYFANPYTDTTTANYTRILAAKNSVGLSSGRTFVNGAVATPIFPSNYVDDPNAGAGSGLSYMEAVYAYYNTPGNVLYAEVNPGYGLPDFIYQIVSSGTAGVLNFNAYTVAGVADPANNTTLNIYTLPVEQLFSGGILTFTGSIPAAVAAELGKLISGLYSIGHMPLTALTTSLSSPFYNNNTSTNGYKDLVYFSNPDGYTGGPWYNFYDDVLHTQMIGKGYVAENPNLGLAYAYDYDDLLLIGGLINGLSIQDQYGNPSQVAGAEEPYIVIELESLDGTTLPNLSADTYEYTVVVGSAGNGVTASFSYYNGGTLYNTSASPDGSTTLAHTVEVNSDNPFTVELTFDTVPYLYNINLLRQIVTPISDTSKYTGADVQYQGGFVFSVDKTTSPYTITLQYNSSPPPWPGQLVPL